MGDPTFLILALSFIGGANADCIWYGQCFETMFGSKQNCLYEGPPKAVDDSSEAWETFKKMCPQMTEKARARGLCCDPVQIETFAVSQAIPESFLGACPTCNANFRNLWCQSTCSPDQSQFLEPLETEHDEDTNTTYITRVRYHVNETYAQELFDSCKDVQMGGTPAIGSMCGLKGLSCTARDWLIYLGDNSFVPFVTEFAISGAATVPAAGTGITGQTEMQPMSDLVIDCAVGITGHEGCKCKDCASACKATTSP